MKVSRLLLTFFSAVNLASINSAALQEFEAVVEDKKFNSSSTIIIDQAEIKKSRSKDLTTLLATQANISVVQSNFQPSSIFLRGGDSSHVLILVDGIPFYDASTVQRTVNLNSFNLKTIQKIEVIKGSQSVLYGGQALSGVIKITTIPKEFKDKGLVNGQLGTRDARFLAAAGTLAIDENQMLIVRASTGDRNNKSPVENSTKIYPSRANSGELGYVYKNENLESFLKVQSAFDRTFITNSNQISFKPVDFDNFVFSTYQFATSGSIKLTTNSFKPQLSLAYQRGARSFEQEDTFGTKQEITGDLYNTRLQFQVFESNAVSVIGGLSYVQEKLDYRFANTLLADTDTNYQGEFLKSDFNLSQDVLLELGVRNDLEKWRSSITTYQAGLILFKTIKAEYSTGYRRPSLTQLFAVFANPNLKPEKSTSASLSYEKNLTEDLFFSITGFDNEFTNLIIARGSPTRYENVAKSRTTGVEASTGLRLQPQQLTINISLGYQEPKDVEAANWLIRRPLRTAGLKVRKDFTDINIGAELVHNGDRRDRTGMTSNGTVAGYTYLNVTTDYKLDENIFLYARGQNITNQIYETTYGYYDEGQSYVVGAEYSF